MLQDFIRVQMAVLPQCVATVSGPVTWREPDGDGCNWTLTKLEGPGCLECLEQLRPMLDSLRECMNLAEPTKHLATSSNRRVVRAIATVEATEAMRHLQRVEESLCASRAAVRQSRALLQIVRQKNRTIARQRERATSALAVSLALLASRPAAGVGAAAALRP